MQGTVQSFSGRERCGAVLLDDGRRLEFGRAAFDRSGLRLLRLGQRVRLQLDDTGRVHALTVATLPLD